ncbi:MAG: thioredoxin domain-containing protein, partial [Phototrophicaceae bacterium]
RFGGFGGAPKFPQPMSIEFLLRSYQHTQDADALAIVKLSLDQMARGGIYDQIGGGFARYATDSIWLVPHFEKMLYDNAQLSRAYLHGWQVTGEPMYRQIAEETYDYILREMTSPQGGFYSATDADSEGEEGKFFVWTIAEVQATLSAEDAKIAIEFYGMSPKGNFEGHNILYRPNTDDVIADRVGLTVEALQARIQAIKAALYSTRQKRVAPGLDDKILASWNGLMLASLAEAARVLGRADYTATAIRAGEYIERVLMTPEGRLYRTAKGETAKLNAYLEDYANVIDAMLELYQLTGAPRWFAHARRLADVVLDQFRADDGGFYDTSRDHEALIVRPRSLQDNATPAGASMFAKQCVRLAAYTGDARYDEAARSTLRLLAQVLGEVPQAFAEALNALDLLVHGVQEVALVGDPNNAATRALLEVYHRTYRPNSILAVAAADVPADFDVPLLSYRIQKGGQPTAYVCRNFVCQLPVSTPADFAQQLAGGGA